MEQKLGWRAVFGTQPDSFEVTRESSSLLPSSPKSKNSGGKKRAVEGYAVELPFMGTDPRFNCRLWYGTADVIDRRPDRHWIHRREVR
jgi:hypothetical protein